MPTRLLLARHGAIEWTGLIGAADDGLSELGRRQAEALGRRLAGEGVVALYSSPLRRALETAEIVARHVGLEVRVEPRLREWHAGEWEGQPEGEMRAKHPEHWEPFRPPGGETEAELRRRVVAATDDIIAAHPEGDVLIMSHGGAIGSFIRHTLGLAFHPRHIPFTIDHCSLTVVDAGNPVPLLLRLNDVCHLAATA
ncbi:MAG: histidine phosphatase family protein [Chloroflexi bacterium]|nr:histidine phosphatase family protein [Chloroflexota bacterium]